MARLGAPELILILVIVLVVFGAGKLPQVGGALGRGIREFKSATKEVNAAKEEMAQVAEETKKQGDLT